MMASASRNSWVGFNSYPNGLIGGNDHAPLGWRRSAVGTKQSPRSSLLLTHFAHQQAFASGQDQLAFESAGTKGVRQAIARVRATATDTFVFAGAPGPLVDVFLEVRTFLPGLV